MKGQPCINVPWQLFLEAMQFFTSDEILFIMNCIYHESQEKVLEKIRNCKTKNSQYVVTGDGIPAHRNQTAIFAEPRFAT